MAEEPKPIAITTEALSQRSFLPEFRAPALVVSLNRSTLSSETSGRLKQLRVLVGERVKRDQPLALLDCRQPEIQQRQALARQAEVKAQLALARRRLSRGISLRQSRNLAEDELDQRRTEVDRARALVQEAEAGLEQAELEVRRCQINAPFDGVVTRRLAAEGQWLVPATPVLELLDTARLEISAWIDNSLSGRLANARHIWFENNAERTPLRLRKLVPALDSRGRNREARLVFSGQSALAGTSGTLVWQDSKPRVGPDLLVRRDGQLGLMLKQQDRAHFLPLPKAVEGQPAEIDLPPDSRVIVDGRQSVNEGDRVIEKVASEK